MNYSLKHTKTAPFFLLLYQLHLKFHVAIMKNRTRLSIFSLPQFRAVRTTQIIPIKRNKERVDDKIRSKISIGYPASSNDDRETN